MLAYTRTIKAKSATNFRNHPVVNPYLKTPKLPVEPVRNPYLKKHKRSPIGNIMKFPPSLRDDDEDDDTRPPPLIRRREDESDSEDEDEMPLYLLHAVNSTTSPMVKSSSLPTTAQKPHPNQFGVTGKAAPSSKITVMGNSIRPGMNTRVYTL